MKRANNIYNKICDKNNIRKAIAEASKGKKNRKEVLEVINNVDYYVDALKNILDSKEIKLSPYKKRTIHDGANKKERIIYKAQFFPDQCIHWCLMLQITDLIKRGMYDYCCASIPGRGIHYGAKYIKRVLKDDRKNTKYCLKLDIKKFYPSINKEICKMKFRRIIKDWDTLDLIDTIIDSSPDGGLPIGNYTSQWFANFYLQDLDHFIKEKLHVKYYVRYMDDMVLFGRNKKELHKVKLLIDEFLKKEELKIKENWQLFKLTDKNPLDFLGYRFYRGYTTLRRKNFLRIKRRVKKIVKRGYIRRTDGAAMISYNGWLKYCNSFNIKNKYIKPYLKMKECKEAVKYGRVKLKNRSNDKTREIRNRKRK